MTTPAAAVSSDELAARYLDAWQAHDVEAVIALHTVESVLTSVATNQEAVGRNAVREMIAQTFALWPDSHFHPIRMRSTPNLIVAESMLEVTQALPLRFGDIDVEPNGKTVTFAVADILVLDDDLVKRKDTYLDTLAYLRQMRAGNP
jgi:predicted ester cyclase